MRPMRGIFVVLLAAAALAAWASNGRAAGPPGDETITFWVKEALREDPRVNASDIVVKTDNGIVTLSGSTRNLAEKNYADLAAKKINGVRGVLDELMVTPVYRFDADIAGDIQQRLLTDMVIKSHGLKVAVTDGEVELTGMVDSWIERQEAGLVASEVRGVKKVDNRLEIDYHSRRSDDEIKMDVVASMRRDDYLTGLPITVTVKNGDVTLTGSVGNAYEQERATYQAYLVDNVKSVTNDLKVEWWEERGARERVPLPTKDQLAQAVRDELYQDMRVEPFEVAVDASYGHVTLRGAVPSYYQKQVAEQDAREVVGVAWVSDLLSVRSEMRSDDSILRDIQSNFDSDYSLNGQDVSIRVADGKVTLSGNVNEYYEKLHAADVASRVRGVWDVVNNIAVNWYPQYNDADLRQRIQDRLAYNAETRWIADRINVKVKDGVVTLTGKVYLWSEREEAGRVALLTDGVLSVDNEIAVSDVNYPWDEWNYALPVLP